MYSKTLALALALTSVISAGPLQRRQGGDPCQDTYKSCVASGVPEVACACDLQACVGEDNARGREFCASATATIVRSSTTAGTRTSTVATPVPTSTDDCESYITTIATPVATSIPGGCNPAHPGSCPTPSAVPVPSGSNPVKTDKSWAVKDLSRYCGEGNTGCDYNFIFEADGKTQRCTVIRNPGKDAATESWSNQPCTGSPYSISWGYAAQPAPAYAIMTVAEGKELAWFGVSNVNSQKVTPSNPFGSGEYGNITAPVYTYN